MKRALALLLALSVAVCCVVPFALAEEKKPPPLTGYHFVLKLAMFAKDYLPDDVTLRPEFYTLPSTVLNTGEDGSVSEIAFNLFGSYMVVSVDAKTDVVQEIQYSISRHPEDRLPFVVSILYMSVKELRQNHVGENGLNEDFYVLAKHLYYPIGQVIETGEPYSDEKFTYSIISPTVNPSISIVPKQ